MKKVTPILAIAALAIAFTSCKKDYTCTCTTTVAGQSSTVDFELGKQKKSDAEAACTAKVTTVAGITSSCSLK